MIIHPIRTNIIRANESTINSILEKYIPEISDRSIVVITSKIVSLCEGRIIKSNDQHKNVLAQKESDYYLPPSKSKYDITLTIKNNLLIPSAGIDESNGDGNFIFWPENPQQSANSARNFLMKKFKLKYLGIVISDSKTTPLRWGTTGTSIAHSGFLAVNDFIGKPDIFGRMLTMTKVNVADALASSAVLTMGESDEQQPLAIIEDVPFVHFQNRNPSAQELEDLHIPIEDDIYAPLLKSVDWMKGKN